LEKLFSEYVFRVEEKYIPNVFLIASLYHNEKITAATLIIPPFIAVN